MSSPSQSLSLAFGLAFEDLYHRSGLERLDAAFARFLEAADAALAQRWHEARRAPDALAYKDEAELLIAVAPHLDAFIARLGEPYVTTRSQGEGSRTHHHGMGLGFFIAKTLLERTGAQVEFRNAKGGGALVAARWRRGEIEAAPGDLNTP